MENTERSKNMRTIELPEGKINILAGPHGLPQEFPEGCENFLDNADLLFIEGVGDYISRPDEFIAGVENHIPQFKKLAQLAKQKGRTLYFPDLFSEEGFAAKTFDMIAPNAEAILGALLAYASLKKDDTVVDSKVDQGRRLVLKLLATWLLSPQISNLVGNKTAGTDVEQVGLKAMHLVRKTHPELYNYTAGVRNLVFAYKLLYGLKNIHKDKNGGEKPSVSMVVGSLHLEGLEEILCKYQKGEITFQQIEEAFLKLKVSYGPYIKNFNTIGSFKFDEKKQKWQNEVLKICNS